LPARRLAIEVEMHLSRRGLARRWNR